MNSAYYMSDNMVQLICFEWVINMADIAQINQTGVDAIATGTKI